ncbi:MAG: hypothetical protein ACKOWO_05250 [Sediminibacterium sp.]
MDLVYVYIATLPFILFIGGMIFLALFVSFGIIGKILLVATIVFYIYRKITRTVVAVYFDLDEVLVKMISGTWFKIPYQDLKHYYAVRTTQAIEKQLLFTFFLKSRKVTKAFSIICPDELEEELGAFLIGKVKKVRY